MDNTVSFLRKSFPSVKIVENNNNLGACKARNQGIEVVRGRYILTLDCDVVLKKNFLFQIKKRIDEAEDKAGMVNILIR